MKKTINARLAILALAILFTTVSPAHASDIPKNAIPVELQYLGNVNKQPLFELKFSNTVAAEFTVVVRDEFNNVLHKETVKGSSFSRKFLFNTEEIGEGSLRFEIAGVSKEQKAVVFEVSNSSRLVKDVVVNKIR